MLHLIREQQLDIFDLDMDILTEQYINYLHSMEELHLEVESEYLVELATLIEYKSRKLLPKQEDTLEGEYEEDPREKLVQRLLEYQRFKEVSSVLYESFLERQDQMSKPVSYAEVVKNSQILSDEEKLEGNPYDLLKAMNKVLRRLQLSRPMDIRYTRKELSTEDRILQIKSRLRTLPKTFTFEDLTADCHDVHEYIVTFLSILDMAKDHLLVFHVDEEERIWFKRGENDDGSL